MSHIVFISIINLIACLGRFSIAQSQSPIGRKHNHLQAQCVQYARWRARALTLDLGCLARVLRHSSRPWIAFLIFPTSNLFRGLAQDLYLASRRCARALLMTLQSPTRPSSILGTRG